MSKYAEYDQKLLILIDGGCRDFDALCSRLADENAVFAKPGERFRVTDRRLQALRKAGKIAYDRSRGVWHRHIPE